MDKREVPIPSIKTKPIVTDRCSKDCAGGKFKLTYSSFKECFHRDAQIIGTIIPCTDRKEPFIQTGHGEEVGGDVLVLERWTERPG